MKKGFVIFLTLLLTLALATPALANTLFIEAELGMQSSAPMIIGSGLGAFNDKYIYGEENSYETINYAFEIKEAGDYYIWFRLMGQDDDHNSFFVMIDGKGFNQNDGYGDGEYYTFDMWEPSEGYDYSESNPFLPSLDNHKDPDWIYNPHWHWIPLSYRDATLDPPVRHNLVTQNFTAGLHTMEIMTREPECYLDKIIITNDLSYDPRAVSGDPEVIYLAELAAAEAAAAAEAEAAAPAPEETPAAAPAPAPAPAAPAPAPQTGDNTAIYIFAFVLVASAAAALLRRRREF